MAGTGLALGGGGSKGAFQIGVWQALRELDLEIEAVAGTSIGAINGAFMAADDLDGALEFWHHLQIQQCVDLADTDLRSTDLLSLSNAGILARELLTHHTLDTQPLRQTLRQCLDEGKIRQSKMMYGLMTATLPEMSGKPFWIADIPVGQLIEFIMASARLPGLDPVTIDGERFIDGGMAEIVPVSMLKKQGCQQIIAVDLSLHPVLRSPILDNINLVYIHDRHDLGGTLDVTPAVLQKNQRLGYLDTLKAFGRLSGESFAFFPDQYRQLSGMIGSEHLSGLEQAGMIYELDRQIIYDAAAFVDQIRTKRLAVQQQYDRQRQALKIDNKLRSIFAGRLKVLDLMPTIGLSFLVELQTRIRRQDSILQIPFSLFPNLRQAADALLALDSDAAAGNLERL